MDYSKYIQGTITHIERHLFDDLALDILAGQAGFSKYHFARIFKWETGMNMWEYIKSRRMAKAARLLMSTDMSIMEIAMICRFNSQEAFTRAFKKIYILPPGKYRRVMHRLIIDEEVINMDNNKVIPGWFMTGSTPEKYEYGLDKEMLFKGAKSVFLKNHEVKMEEDDFGTVMQQFKAANYLEKRIRFSGFVKAADVEGWGGLWVRIDGVNTNILKFDNMQSRAIKGSTDWNYYSVVLDVPENSAVVSMGMLLSGKGKLWLDNVRFELVDDSVPTTDVDISSGLPEGPVNLTFEE